MLSCIIEYVCAIAHKPPNDESVRTKGNVVWRGWILLLIQWIPFVISKKGKIYFVHGRILQMEKFVELITNILQQLGVTKNITYVSSQLAQALCLLDEKQRQHKEEKVWIKLN